MQKFNGKTQGGTRASALAQIPDFTPIKSRIKKLS